MSDSEIIQRILAGEKEAFSILVKKYQNAIHGIAFYTTQNTHDAEDIAQETFMEAFHHLPTLKEPDKFASWLRAIANNLCVSWIRRKKSQATLEERLSNRPETSEISADFESLRIDTYEALMKVVNTLSELNRVVIILKYLEGMSNLEIAEFLGISSSAVNVRIHRSMKQLHGKITKALEEGFKDKRLDESFAERVHKRIAERKPVTALTVKFCNATDDQRAAIQQLILNSNATILDNLPEIPLSPPLPKGGTITPKVRETEVSTSKARGTEVSDIEVRETEVSTPEVKGDRGDFSEKALMAFYGVPTTRESDPIRAANTALTIQEQFRGKTKVGIGLCFGTVELQSQQDGVEAIVPTEQLMSKLSTLQAAAEEDVIVDDSIYQLLETRYEFEEGECLRGEPPIYTYQLLSAHNLDAHSEGYQQIELNRLSREQSRRLLSQICNNLECASSVCFAKTKFSHSSTNSFTYTDIQRHILDRANGNPFYLEEMARASMQSASFSQHYGRVPYNIQSVVLSRVDQLDPIRKPVIQYAAVLGESFRSSILSRLFPQVDKESGKHLATIT